MPPKPDRVTGKQDWLGGLDLDGLIGLSLSTPPEEGTSTGWQPPPIETVARGFPHYEILDLLGRGGMGAVYLARHRSLDRRVALKLLPGEYSGDEKFVQRFHREARALARLQHPNIVGVHDFGSTADGWLYFAMEHVGGRTLGDLIRERRPGIPEVLDIAAQICDALSYAHDEGIVHRDIKPSNILVDGKGRVKVADFGLAKVAMEAHPSLMEGAMHTRTGAVLGTAEYAAPEQMGGAEPVDHRADLFSLGVVLHEMLTGQVPRGVFDPPSRKSGVDPRFDAVVLRAMREEPDRRYPNAAALKADLIGIAQPPHLPKRPVSRPPGLWAVALAVGLIAGGGGYWFWNQRPADQKAPPAPIAAKAADKSGAAPIPPAATFRGRHYTLATEPLTWATANDRALARGGRLAVVPDAETNQWLTETFAGGQPRGLFLGGHCWRPGGAWEWSASQPWQWSGWEGEAPLFGALVLGADGRWQAVSFEETRPFVIESDTAL